MRKLTLSEIDVQSARVLMRVDFNVPQNEDGSVRDDTRIRAALKSINYVRDRNGSLVLMSHLGRPKGRPDPKYRMDPVANRLRELLHVDVHKLDVVAGPEAESAAAALNPGDVLLLENTRFEPGETENDPELSAALARLGDLYVTDAFGSAHRAHASTTGAAAHFDIRAAGFLMAKELEYFGRILEAPERPFAAILGGAKVSDKIGAIENLLNLVDTLLVGGGMAYTFLKAQGFETGDSLLDSDAIHTAGALMENAREKGVELLLPSDVVVADAFAPDARTETVNIDGIRAGWQGLDIGPETVDGFRKALAGTQTVVWNGPLGVFEMEPFSRGTRAIAETLAGMNATTVIGGGDTAAAIAQYGLEDAMSHVSTGGGASLEMLEGKELPGVAVLSDAP